MALTFTLSGLKDSDDVNRLTTALMELDGVDTVQVAREWLEVEGRVQPGRVVEVIEKLGFSSKR
ncbi:hypothetical protein M1D97_08525 [Kushneria sp. AK178]|uniref:HMA domain-containing protein n=1 Tax=Kushneria indalinina DSM 14324 TaxID=1122140 RepID=A0A3D9DZQ0_9GAMM|nr:hypothetical protein [Kushneria indalinina]REC96263.1 hypothetical protein C8D72_0944 [Kushneria indalinina DSM 14324]